ncbi:MAG: PssD/Cps14F family polysaccharide biosynthesis glycosyltransferase [Candidatus Diapherotrites archaeon]|nr:PssD/Cps14F family polysaccharide biosynthesis glycosyltransferase [Candidatus Diapherotrites archaeon]MDZ4256054.1 PssD/Cps14F family polysaccharide biosynthesis glycosyltransferase [archaeon]
MKLLLTCSAGGHLTEMRQLAPFYSKHDHVFVTFQRDDTLSLSQYERVHFISRPARHPIKTIQAFFRAWKIISQEQPDLVISTGADVTVPVCLAAKIKGVPIVFIESFCRVTTPGWTGRIISPLADHVIYQWKTLKKWYPSGIFGGSIFVRPGDDLG